MEYRKGEGYDWILMGFGVLIAAVFTQESVLTLVLGLAVVMLLFAGVRLVAKKFTMLTPFFKGLA